MPTRRRALLVLPVASLIASIAQASESIRGSGVMRSESRSLPAFDAIALLSPVDVHFVRAATVAVELRGDDNILPAIETRVVQRDGVSTLEVGMRRNTSISTRNALTLEVRAPSLKAMTIEGSGDARLEQLEGEALSIAIRGSGDVVASGRVGKLAVSISGSGDVDARELEAQDASVAIKGSGDATVHARKSLVASIAGSGDVAYRGDPAVTSQVAGSGSVHKLR